MNKKILAAGLVLILPVSISFGQIASSPNFTLEKALVSNGGGASAGATFSVEGTIGQAAAAASSGNFYRLDGGYWSPAFAPTAANVSLSGRVLTADGRGLVNASVFLTDSAGGTRTARTSTFGFYRFDAIEAGQTLIIGVRSKLYQFETRVIPISADMTNIDFMPVGKQEAAR